MTQQTMALPTAHEVEEGAKSILAVGAVLGGAYAIARRWLQRRRRAQERRAIEEQAIRYLLDAQRHTLNVLVPGEDRSMVDIDELRRQKLLVDQIRDRLWHADGHSQSLQSIVEVLSRTQRIKAKQDHAQDDEGDQG